MQVSVPYNHKSNILEETGAKCQSESAVKFWLPEAPGWGMWNPPMLALQMGEEFEPDLRQNLAKLIPFPQY